MILSTTVAVPMQRPGYRIWQRRWSRSRMTGTICCHCQVEVIWLDAVRGLVFHPMWSGQ